MYYMLAVTILSLALCVRWAYVSHRALKTLAKSEQYNGLAARALKELDAEITECLPLIPLARAYPVYKLHERIKGAARVFESAAHGRR